MKADIHPEYGPAHVRCTCGNEFWTRSTKPELHVEICSNCHPFYTGRQKLVDTGGRVERFRRRAARSRQGLKPPQLQRFGKRSHDACAGADLSPPYSPPPLCGGGRCRAAPASVKLVTCSVETHEATFSARMQQVPGASRMAMRFTLFEQTGAEARSR